MTNEQTEQIAALRKDGYGYSIIAGKIGLSVNTVKSYCRRNHLNSKMDEPVIAETGVCRNCGAKYIQTPKQKRRVFCSDKCRVDWWSRNYQLQKREERVCKNCNVKFHARPGSKQSFCSHQCYILYRFGKGDERV